MENLINNKEINFDFNINNILNLLLEKRLEKELNNPLDNEYANKLREILLKNKHNNIDIIMNENSEKEESFIKIVSAKPWSKLNKNEKEQLLKKYCDEKKLDEEKYNELLTNINKRKIKVKDIEYDKQKQCIININYQFN